MRAFALLAIAVAAGVAAMTATASSRPGALRFAAGDTPLPRAESARRPAARLRLHDVRACSYPFFRKRRPRFCVKDESGGTLDSNTFACSLDVEIGKAEIRTWRVTYDGALVYSAQTALEPGSYIAWVWLSLITGVPQPGGAWKCEYTLGPERASAAWRSGGPTGQVVDVVACDESGLHVAAFDPLFGECRSYPGLTVFQSPRAIACTAAIPVRDRRRRDRTALPALRREPGRPDPGRRARGDGHEGGLGTWSASSAAPVSFPARSPASPRRFRPALTSAASSLTTRSPPRRTSRSNPADPRLERRNWSSCQDGTGASSSSALSPRGSR